MPEQFSVYYLDSLLSFLFFLDSTCLFYLFLVKPKYEKAFGRTKIYTLLTRVHMGTSMIDVE